MEAKNDGRNGGGPSEETERRASAGPAVIYLLRAIPGSPGQRAQAVAQIIQDHFQKDGFTANAARSALESFCNTHKLDVYDYLKPKPIQVDFPISVTS